MHHSFCSNPSFYTFICIFNIRVTLRRVCAFNKIIYFCGFNAAVRNLSTTVVTVIIRKILTNIDK